MGLLGFGRQNSTWDILERMERTVKAISAGHRLVPSPHRRLQAQGDPSRTPLRITIAYAYTVEPVERDAQRLFSAAFEGRSHFKLPLDRQARTVPLTRRSASWAPPAAPFSKSPSSWAIRFVTCAKQTTGRRQVWAKA